MVKLDSPRQLQVVMVLALVLGLVLAAPVACSSASGPHALLNDTESPLLTLSQSVEWSPDDGTTSRPSIPSPAHHLLPSLMPTIPMTGPVDSDGWLTPGAFPSPIAVITSPQTPPPRGM